MPKKTRIQQPSFFRQDLPAEDGRTVCENRGTGIAAMLEALRAAGMEPPRFDDRRTTFRLTFRNASLLDESTLDWLHRFAGHDLDDVQRLALAYAHRQGRLTRADYRRLNPGIDSMEATRDLLDLVRRGLLQQHGTRRWTYYTLANAAAMLQPSNEAVASEATSASTRETPQAVELTSQAVELAAQSVELVTQPVKLSQRAAPSHVRQTILSLCGVAPLSSEELAERLHRDRTYLLNRYLSALVAEGLLERTGTAPTDPNVRYRTTEAGRHAHLIPKDFADAP